jgi:hypothetical protein
MKLDELEKMAQQTAAYGVHPSGEFIYSFYTEQLQALARLIAEHEREQCKKLCQWKTGNQFVDEAVAVCYRAIDQRGQA